MKKIGFKYFFLLFITVISCFGIYTKSIQNTSKVFSPYHVQHAEFNAERKHQLSQSSLAYDFEYENFNVCETEIDESDSESSLDDSYFSKFLENNLSINQLHSVKNGLKDCFFDNYLSTIQSFNVLFCVFRL